MLLVKLFPTTIVCSTRVADQDTTLSQLASRFCARIRRTFGHACVSIQACLPRSRAIEARYWKLLNIRSTEMLHALSCEYQGTVEHKVLCLAVQNKDTGSYWDVV